MTKEQLLLTKEELTQKYMLDRDGSGLRVYQRGQYTLDYDNVKDMFYLTDPNGVVRVVDFEYARDFVMSIFEDKSEDLKDLLVAKVDRLEEVKRLLEDITKDLNEEKKVLEKELKDALKEMFVGEPVSVRGTEVTYFLHERTTTTLDKVALEKEFGDLSPYSKKTTTFVLNNQTNRHLDSGFKGK